jgi:hypothetical protein
MLLIPVSIENRSIEKVEDISDNERLTTREEVKKP